jgi:two-component system sensor histidine kinase BarA
MNIIAVNTHLLDQTPLTEMQKGIISRTRRASSAMLSLLDQVLEYSKLEAGEIQLDLAPFSLTELLNNILLLQRGTARDKSVDFLIVDAAIIPDTWLGDRRHIEKILIHLTSNAIKCTDTGQIRIKASLDQRPGENQALRIEVTDTGRGIPEDQLPMLFQPFKRISHPSGEPVKGTGLGLSISKRLVELMGGRIGVNSALGLGSCFWFTVPTATSDPDSPPPLSDPLS